jgi:hypothetical protein
MIAARKLVAAILIGIIASSQTFKPSNTALRPASPSAASVSFDEVPDISTSSRDVARGGDCTNHGLIHLHKTDVVKYHGFCALLFGALFFWIQLVVCKCNSIFVAIILQIIAAD